MNLEKQFSSLFHGLTPGYTNSGALLKLKASPHECPANITHRIWELSQADRLRLAELWLEHGGINLFGIHPNNLQEGLGPIAFKAAARDFYTEIMASIVLGGPVWKELKPLSGWLRGFIQGRKA